MTDFVLDNSVSMRWLLESEKTSDQRYAVAVLKSLAEAEALIPNLWHLEATNVLLGAERRHEIESGETERFISQLERLPLHIDPLTSHHAAYLELAIRQGLPLATLDKALKKAAKKADVVIYLEQ